MAIKIEVGRENKQVLDLLDNCEEIRKICDRLKEKLKNATNKTNNKQRKSRCRHPR